MSNDVVQVLAHLIQAYCVRNITAVVEKALI